MARKKRVTSVFAQALGKNLRAARGARSIQEIADSTNGFVHARMVQNYEAGTEPKLSTFLVLAAALGHRPQDLIPKNITSASEAKNVDRIVRAVTVAKDA